MCYVERQIQNKMKTKGKLTKGKHIIIIIIIYTIAQGSGITEAKPSDAGGWMSHARRLLTKFWALSILATYNST